jgi:TPR repeat protein
MAATEPARSAETPPTQPIVPPAPSAAPTDDRRAGLEPAPASPAAAAPPTAPPGLADLTVPQVIARAPGVAEIAGEAAARAGRGLHEDSLLLWEAAARLGHAPSLTALGRLYDPVGFQPGRPFRTPDPRQAARYYQQAVRAGDAGAEAPRSALRDWL